MTVTGTIYGHAVVWDDGQQRYLWADTHEPAHRWGGEPRPCPQCGVVPTTEGHDACLGHIPGVYSACCGHGVEDGVILWEATLGSPLRRTRLQRGLSLRDVAPHIGMSISYMSDLERGRKGEPSLSVARSLAAFYGVTIDELFSPESGTDREDG